MHAAATAQASPPESHGRFYDHPRLFLTAKRLRLLKRERDRNSPRWQRLDELVSSGAPLPEPGFALALHYQVSGNRESGTRAVEWARGPDADLRQMSLVYDSVPGRHDRIPENRIGRTDFAIPCGIRRGGKRRHDALAHARRRGALR